MRQFRGHRALRLEGKERRTDTPSEDRSQLRPKGVQVKKYIALFAVAAAAVPSVALAESGGLKVTGGGQVLADGQGSGPGDNLGFVAQQTGDFVDGVAPAKGQLQVNKRADGSGRPVEKFHGTVTCIRTYTNDQGDADPSNDETFVRFGGILRDGRPFTTDVQDNGEGLSGGNDTILFRARANDEDPCDNSDQSTDLRSATLARGNVQQH